MLKGNKPLYADFDSAKEPKIVAKPSPRLSQKSVGLLKIQVEPFEIPRAEMADLLERAAKALEKTTTSLGLVGSTHPAYWDPELMRCLIQELHDAKSKLIPPQE